MKVQSVTIKNFKALDSAQADLRGHNVYLIGRNEAGKSTFIEAAFGNMPERPLRNGAAKGEVIIELDDYTCEFKFSATNQKPKLSIYDKSGEPQKTPATLFKKLFGVKDFDIEEFLRLSDTDQVNKIKGLVGIEWSEIDKDYKSAYEERTWKNRQLKELETKLQGTPFKLNLEPIQIDEIQTRLNESIETNGKIEKVKSGIEYREKGVKVAETEIERLKQLIADQEAIVEANKADIEKGNEWLKTNTVIDITTLQEEVNEAIRTNSEVEQHKIILAQRQETERLTFELADLQRKMDDIQALKKRQLSECKMPVPGLTFDDDRLFLDGLPFKSDQVNTAKRIVAGLQIQQALMSDVRIARFDGSLLDKKSLAYVLDWAKETNVQLFVEYVDRDGGDLQIKISEE